MQSQITLQKRDVIAAALSRQAGSRTRSELHKRPRLLERFMGSIMLLCGVVSIFTTVGIVAVLGKESLLFFTPPAWIDTFKTVEQ